MNGRSETKSEIRTRIDELQIFRESFYSKLMMSSLENYVERRIKALREALEMAEEDMSFKR